MQTAPRGGGIELTTVLRFVDLATDALAAAREEIDALNIYPVPDGDTGTNMYLTMASAREAVVSDIDGASGGASGEDGPATRDPATGEQTPGREDALATLARGAFLGARGNAGVILSEMLGAVTRRIARATGEERNAVVMAEALSEATEASYRAVEVPVEGTMLSVARAAADAARECAADPQARGRDVLTSAAESAREALARTPEQLDVLHRAGVVDAGARGLCVLLDAAETALTGRRPVPVATGLGHHRIPVPAVSARAPAEPAARPLPPGPAYEVMYLLEADDDRVPALRERLAPLGDSLVVVGGEGAWNVHVHVDDVGAAIEAGIEVGRPHRVRVTHFAEQGAHERNREPHERRVAAPPEGRAVVAVAAGPGLVSLFEQAGAIVVPGGPGRRPAVEEVLAAITGSGAREVVVLPNDPDSARVAQAAAGSAETDHGLRVAVIPTRAQVQGLAAMAVHEPGRGFDADVLEMTATARHARQGGITLAARAALTMAGWCEPGDVLGVVEGDFVLIGSDQHQVATDVLDRLLGGGGELVTLVTGAGAGDLADRTAAWVGERHPYVDVVVHDGGQERYPLLVSVE